MIFEEFTEGHAAAPFGVGDPVIITGNVEYQGRTGDVREIGRDGAFVVVDLYNYGPYSFHASDVSYNDYADSEDELNEFALDDSDDPTEDYPCYDCGSTIFLHHTKLCDLAEPNAKRDLPAEPGTQYWTGEIPKGLAPIPGLAEGSNTKTIKPITPAAKRYHEKHQWLLNGNIPGAAKEHYDMIQKLNQKSVAEGNHLGNILPWPEVVNKINSAMRATGWKSQRKDDNSFMFSTKGQLDDEFYIVIIDNQGNGKFTYAIGTVEEGDPHIGERDTLPNTDAGISELTTAITQGFGMTENVKESENPYGYKVGQIVKLSNGKQGRVLDIFDDSIEVLMPNGRTVTVDFRDAEVLSEQGAAAPTIPGRGVDAKGRTQAEWLRLVKQKFPSAKVMIAKMQDGPAQAVLPDGRKLSWSKVEQTVAEGEYYDKWKQRSDARYDKASDMFNIVQQRGKDRANMMSRHSHDSREQAHKRHQEKLDKAHQDYLATPGIGSRGNTSNTGSGTYGNDERAHQAQQRMARDEYDTQRRKDDDEDTRKTFDMMRDRLNRMQYKNQRDVDPKQLAKISAIKYNPIKEGAEQMTPNWAKYVLDQLYNSNGDVTMTDLFDEGIPGLRDMFMDTAQEHGLDPDEDFMDVEHEVIVKLENFVKGGHELDEGDKIGNMPADRFDDAMARLKQLAGAGPLKTVWDPQKRVYRNVPTAEQPKK